MKLIDIVASEMENIKNAITKDIMGNDKVDKADLVEINTLLVSIDNKLKLLNSISTYDKWISFVMGLFELLKLKDQITSGLNTNDTETENAVDTVSQTYRSIMYKMDVEFKSNYSYIYMLLILLYVKSENNPDFLKMDLVADVDKILLQIANRFANVDNVYLKIYILTGIFMLIQNIDLVTIRIEDMASMQELISELVMTQENNATTTAKIKKRIKHN